MDRGGAGAGAVIDEGFQEEVGADVLACRIDDGKTLFFEFGWFSFFEAEGDVNDEDDVDVTAAFAVVVAVAAEALSCS